jgi:hypothetical protein
VKAAESIRKGSLIAFLKQELYPEADWVLPVGLDSIYYPLADGAFSSAPFLDLWLRQKGTEKDQGPGDS